MEYTLKINDNDASVDLTLNFTKEDIAKSFDKEYYKAQKKVKVNGFRPGKAPIDVVKKVIGDKIAKDAIDSLITEHMNSLITQLEPAPISSPKITVENYDKNEGLSVKAVYDILPIVELSQYKGLKWENYSVLLSEDDVNEKIEHIRESLSTQKLLDIDEKTELGCLLEIDFRAFPDDADMNDPNLRQKYVTQKITIKIGDPTNLPGLDGNLIGLSVGETKIFDYEYPEGFADEKLVGQKVKMEVIIKEAHKIILPDINDDLAKEWDEKLASLEELKEKVRHNLTSYYEHSVDQKVFTKILEKVRESSKCVIPKILITNEMGRGYMEILQNNGIKPISFEEFCKRYNYEQEKLAAALSIQSEIRLKNTYIIHEIGKVESLLASENDVVSYVKNLDESEETKKSILNNAEEKNILTQKINYDKVYKFVKENSEKSDLIALTKKQAIEFLDTKTETGESSI